ncbi:hypothetical protein ACPCSP_25675 [Streptomyces cinereoruber]|uniref:hypothetical protein n=1 Tax=Streptomyces cinereoruber TaxID=67260 RepID=UPI003C2B7116
MSDTTRENEETEDTPAFRFRDVLQFLRPVQDDQDEDADGGDGLEDAGEERPVFRVRDVFQFRRPAAEDDTDDDQEETVPEAPVAAPASVRVPQARPVDASGHRMPNWWETDKSDLAPRTPPAPKVTDGVNWVGRVPHHVPAATLCSHPAPHAVRAQPTNKLVAFWCEDCATQLEVPPGYDELEEVTAGPEKAADGEEEAEEDDRGEQGGKGIAKVPAAIRARWNGSFGGRVYSRPAYRSGPAPKLSLIQIWGRTSPKTRHLLYNGTALGVGFWFGVPQWFTAEVAYLDATYDSWTEPYVCLWYGIAVGIWAIDHRTGRWLPPFALIGRIPLISMIFGVLLYGTPALVS